MTTTTRDRVLLFIVVFVAAALGRISWWLPSITVFVGLLAMMLIDRRRPITAPWVLLMAGIALVAGALSRLR
jgi:hypothetical protein